MCGIAGIINLDLEPLDVDFLSRMSAAVKHRGPDGEGALLLSSLTSHENPRRALFRGPFWAGTLREDPSHFNIGFAHQRLSILDLSERGRQPMSDEEESLWIVHNGEVYNYIEIRKELIAKGYRFRSNTDTEVILYAYKEWGQDCLNKFNGMWAFAIWDCSKKHLFCSRDRFGVKPFYYYFDHEIFIFASEIKQILEYKKYQKKPNDQRIFDYLAIGLEDHTRETFFMNIYQLKGGEWGLLDYEKNEFRIDRFYDLSPLQGKYRRNSDYDEEFKTLFYDAVNMRLRSDVPVGSCLSGGLDSSSVVCAISEIFKSKNIYHKTETFTACWENENINERPYAEQVIAHTGSNGNFVFPTAEELRTDLAKLIWHQEEPFGSLSIYAQWSVMKKARDRGVPVLLDGQGGDEVFLGYERYYAWFLMELLKSVQYRKFWHELISGTRNSKLNVLEMVEYYVYFNSPRIRAFFLNRKSQSFMNNQFQHKYDMRDSLKEFKKIKNLFGLQKMEIQEIQLSHLLKYADRNSMAFAIETRLPFLDYRLVEFACSLPSGYKIHDGWTKNVIREGMKGVIPEEIRKRKEKIGFEVPQKKLMESLLPKLEAHPGNENLVGPYINWRWYLKKIQDNDFEGSPIWKAFCLKRWLETFFS
jgi:asparagine synthase (glutamine-hydrolysing)